MKRLSAILSVFLSCALLTSTVNADIIELPFVPIEDITDKDSEENELPVISESDKIQNGDINGDSKIDASDASDILRIYAELSTSGLSAFSKEQLERADVNKDGKVNASDASTVLMYYAYVSTGGTDSFGDFVSSELNGSEAV